MELPYYANSAISDINRLVEEYEAKIKKLNKQIKALSSTSKVEGYLPYKIFSDELRGIRVAGVYGDKKDFVFTKEQAEEFFKQDKETRQKNLIIAAENQKKFDSLIILIQKMGIEVEEWHRKSSRSYKQVKKTPDWLALLTNKFNLTEPRWHEVESYYTGYFRNLEKFEASKKEQERLEVDAREAEKKKKELDFLVAKLALKYAPEIQTIDAEAVREAILAQNKYLKLAHFLQLNRNDWSDGYNYAERGLATFTCVTDEDKAIKKETERLFTEFDDGRVFRDYEWNYNVLFEKVRAESPALLEDYQQLEKLAPSSEVW